MEATLKPTCIWAYAVSLALTRGKSFELFNNSVSESE